MEISGTKRMLSENRYLNCRQVSLTVPLRIGINIFSQESRSAAHVPELLCTCQKALACIFSEAARAVCLFPYALVEDLAGHHVNTV